MGFRMVKKFKEAVPLSQAGLLWFSTPEYASPRPDRKGYWRDVNNPASKRLWSGEWTSGVRYYVLLED